MKEWWRTRGAAAAGISAAILVAWAAATCRASVVTGVPETWDEGLRGWTNLGGVATLDNPNQYLHIAFGPTNELTAANEADTIVAFYPPATNLFIGNYVAASVRRVGFRFLASDRVPGALDLQFQGTDRHLWKLSLSLPPLGVWTPYTVPLTYSAGWSDGFERGSAEFLQDLESVDWIGLYIKRAGDEREEYGLDDFSTLYAPEPGDLSLLGAALLGLAGTFRRRARPLLAGLRAAARAALA